MAVDSRIVRDDAIRAMRHPTQHIGHCVCLAEAELECDDTRQRQAAQLFQHAPIRREAVVAAVERKPRLVIAHLRLQAGNITRRYIRRVGDKHVDAQAGRVPAAASAPGRGCANGPSRSPCTNVMRASALWRAAFERATASASGDRSDAHTRHRGRSAASVTPMAPLPVPTSTTVGPSLRAETPLAASLLNASPLIAPLPAAALLPSSPAFASSVVFTPAVTSARCLTARRLRP